MEYTIGEVAKILDITPSTLRYYDKEGLLPLMRRSASGIRSFNNEDLSLLRLVQCLKTAGMSIKDIKQFIDWTVMGDATIIQRRDMFLKQKAKMEKKLAEMERTYNTINYKCWFYQTAATMGTVDFDLEELPEEIKQLRTKSGLYQDISEN